MNEPPDWLRERMLAIGDYQRTTQADIDVSSPDTKGRIDLVTEVDRTSEERLTTAIQQHHPDDTILAEEGFHRSGSTDRTWIIDPLDGTTNYVHHHPFYGISVGVKEKHRLTLGAAYFPELDDFYWAGLDQGTHKNGESLRISQTTGSMNALLATGFADLRRRDEETRYNLNAFTDIVQRVQGVRRGGSAVHDLCLTAEGVFEGFWEFNLQPWDVAAGVLMIREAGGVVSDMSGGDDWLHGEQIVAGNETFHERILDWLEDHRPGDAP